MFRRKLPAKKYYDAYFSSIWRSAQSSGSGVYWNECESAQPTAFTGTNVQTLHGIRYSTTCSSNKAMAPLGQRLILLNNSTNRYNKSKIPVSYFSTTTNTSSKINNTTSSIDLSTFANGMYYLKIQTDDGTKIIKLIKK